MFFRKKKRSSFKLLTGIIAFAIVFAIYNNLGGSSDNTSNISDIINETRSDNTDKVQQSAEQKTDSTGLSSQAVTPAPTAEAPIPTAVPQPTEAAEPTVTPTAPSVTPTPATQATGYHKLYPSVTAEEQQTRVGSEGSKLSVFKAAVFTETIPEYSGKAYYVLNYNVPYFGEYNPDSSGWEYYSSQDSLGRCTFCSSYVGTELMPTEERGSIGAVKPTAWHTVKYDCVDGKYLYNRCHLIGYQLTAENANVNNLVTGTRYLNVKGMLPFENMVADYIESSGNHVMYRATPVFVGDNLLCSGIILEGWSSEDHGEGICFCVFCYNVQPGIGIDYATGESWEITE